jgi:hypothetical protein
MIHQPGEAEAPGSLLAREFLPGATRYLLRFDCGEGRFAYRYERPRYAWAETVVRPIIPAPKTRPILEALGPEWTDQDLPGMTGIVRTKQPIGMSPEEVFGILQRVDVGHRDAISTTL